MTLFIDSLSRLREPTNMDAHYNEVMKRRNQIQESGTRLYFAYSGVLDLEAFQSWIEEHSYQFFQLPKGQVAEAIDVDLIFDFPSRWWGGRVAGLVDQKSSSVFGLLFEIPAKEWPIVQHKEGVVTGMSVEKTVTVKAAGQEFKASAFVTSPTRASLQGPISERYLEALTRGAQQSGLPDSYIASLKTKAV